MTDLPLRRPIETALTGYELGVSFGVFVPEQTENLWIKGSFDTLDGLNYREIRSTVSQATQTRRYGTGSLRVHGHGVRIPLPLPTVNFWHTVSVDLWAGAGQRFRLSIVSGTGGTVGERIVVATGYFARDEMYVTAEMRVGTGYFLHVARLEDNADPWVLDRPQMEPKRYPTSWVSGRQPHWYMGKPGVVWNGTPYASSSTRGWYSRGGGRLLRFADAGFAVTAFSGLGQAPIQHVTNPFAELDGTYHQRQRRRHRQFVIRGNFITDNLGDLLRRRALMGQMFARTRSDDDDPIIMRFQMVGIDDHLVGREFDIVCRYISGLEGRISSDYGEQIDLTFVADDPYIWEPGDWVVTDTLTGSGNVNIPIEGDVPTPCFIEVQGTGRLRSIHNLINNQTISLDYTLPGAGAGILRLSPNQATWPVQAGLYHPVTDALINDLSANIVPGGHLPIFSLQGTSYTLGLKLTNILQFNFEATPTVNATITVHARPSWSGVDAFADIEI